LGLSGEPEARASGYVFFADVPSSTIQHPLSLSVRLRQFLLVLIRHGELFACRFMFLSIFRKMRVASAL